MTDILAYLNEGSAETRLEHLRKLMAEEKEPPKALEEFSNNHIHTTFSFSPYSPTAAVWFARAAGLRVAGIMDHDSMGGAAEFRKAGRIAGVGTTCGFEARISYADTFLANTKINNPDQVGVGYMTFHSIREEYFDQVQQFLAPLREKRNIRSRKITENAARMAGVELDFDKDVVPVSQFENGGAITERHVLYALTKKLLPEGTEAERFKLLGKMKAEMMGKIYVPATDELMSLDEAVDFAKQVGAILCYAYLGDVTDSPTGDKKAAKYEDSYLPELIELLKSRHVPALTFMPSRNTIEQLDRIMDLCRENGLIQISGEDINSPGQSFICERLADPRFRHLVDMAHTLVEREL